jgi:Fic family protein
VRLGKKLPRAKELVANLYRNPRVDAADVCRILGVTPKTANELIQDFVRLSVLVEVTGGRRNRVFSFKEYMSLFSH